MKKLHILVPLIAGVLIAGYGVNSSEGHLSLSKDDYKGSSSPQACTVTISSGNPKDIQKALATAQNNRRDDVICIEGTYNLNATLTYKLPAGSKECGKGLTIKALSNTAILDGRNSHRILRIDTFICGNKSPAGKIVIEGIKFQNGSANKHAGGLFVSTYKDSVNLTDNIFINNINLTKDAGYNGGGAAIHSWYGSIILANNTFIGNNAGSSSGGGAFIHSIYGSVTITNNTFDGNSAYNSGGLWVHSDHGSVRLINNTFINNTAGLHYGGADVTSYSNSVVLINNTFIGNTARFHGGGASVGSGSGTTLINNVFSGNRTYESSSDGGGVHLGSDSAPIMLINNTFSNNSAGRHGGGVYVELGSKATFHFYNNILWKNTTRERDDNGGDDLYVGNEDIEKQEVAQVNIAHNLFTTTQQPIDFSTAPQTKKVFIKAREKYNQNIADGCIKSGNYGNIQADPRFVDPQKGDFRLQQGSPAIDAGCNNAPGIPQTDKDGKQRIRNNTVDMGAYEFGR